MHSNAGRNEVQPRMTDILLHPIFALIRRTLEWWMHERFPTLPTLQAARPHRYRRLADCRHPHIHSIHLNPRLLIMNTLLQALTREGVLINVSVRYWRAHKKLRPEDIGLQPEAISNRLVQLGHKRLLPREATASLALIESRAHAIVEANTFPFLNGLAHFLPNPRLSEVNGGLKTLESEFWSEKTTFLSQYARLREEALLEWRHMAERLSQDPARLLSSIEASFPPLGHLEKSFGFDVQLFQISIPERLGLDLVSFQHQEQLVQAREEASREAAARIRRQAESFVGECVASLRQQTASLCEEMLQSIRTGESGVHQKTLNRLIRFIDQFKQMNFVGDAEMERQLERVRRELLTRTAEEYRSGGSSARASLESGLAKLADTARQLATQDATELVQRFGKQGSRKFHLAA